MLPKKDSVLEKPPHFDPNDIILCSLVHTDPQISLMRQKLRVFVTSRRPVIQGSINQCLFSNLRLEPRLPAQKTCDCRKAGSSGKNSLTGEDAEGVGGIVAKTQRSSTSGLHAERPNGG